jgi:phosphoglycolate phosphatase
LQDALRIAVPCLEASRYPELGLRYRNHYLARQHELSLFAGTLELLQSLKARNHWLAVATGKTRRGLDDVLNTSQLKGMFDGSRTADETASKPNPMMLLQLMREFGADPEATLMIGDTTHDLQLAANAGTPSVAVSYGAHEREAFGEFSPLHVAHSTAELRDWLLAHA